MKTIYITATLIVLNGLVYGQTLKKGNLVGIHVITIELNPGVTMQEFQDFHINKLVPEYEKHYIGWQMYLAKGVRGENKNTYGNRTVGDVKGTGGSWWPNQKKHAIDFIMTTEALPNMAK